VLVDLGCEQCGLVLYLMFLHFELTDLDHEFFRFYGRGFQSATGPGEILFCVDLVGQHLQTREGFSVGVVEVIGERVTGSFSELQFLGFGEEIVGGYGEFVALGSLGEGLGVGVAGSCYVLIDVSADGVLFLGVGEGELAELFPADGRF